MSISHPKIGFIGIGLMGQPMAENLISAGFDLTVYNRTAAKCAALVNQGAQLADTPRCLATSVGAGVIVICVSDTAALQSSLLGKDGVLAGLVAGATVIDMGSSEVSITRGLAAQVQAQGGHYIDAPVSGGEVGARNGSLSIMAGGDPADILAVAPLFDVLGNAVTRVGNIGAGQAAKIANQTIVGATVAIVAESLVLAQAAGADITQVRTALLSGFAGSRILDLHGQRMIEGAFTPGARATTQAKDMRQAIKLANELGLSFPLMINSRDLWVAMAESDLKELDQSGYFAFVKAAQDA